MVNKLFHLVLSMLLYNQFIKKSNLGNSKTDQLFFQSIFLCKLFEKNVDSQLLSF